MRRAVMNHQKVISRFNQAPLIIYRYKSWLFHFNWLLLLFFLVLVPVWHCVPNVKFTCKRGVLDAIIEGKKSVEFRLSTPHNDAKVLSLRSGSAKFIWFFNARGFFKDCPLVICQKGSTSPKKKFIPKNTTFRGCSVFWWRSLLQRPLFSLVYPLGACELHQKIKVDLTYDFCFTSWFSSILFRLTPISIQVGTCFFLTLAF